MGPLVVILQEQGDSSSYDMMIKQEAEFWAARADNRLREGFSPDLSKPFKADTVEAIWDDSRLNFMIRGKYINKILDHCSKMPHIECLELCCGTGMLSLGASRRGAKVTGIDVSKRVIEVADKYARELGVPLERLEYKVCDLNRATLPESRYDVVFAWDGLHHIADVDHIVGEVKRSLKDGGVFVVHDHARHDSRLEGVIRLGIAAALYLLIPIKSCLRARLKDIVRSSARLKDVYKDSRPEESDSPDYSRQGLHSPFEDVSGEEIVRSIEASFTILESERYLSLPVSLYARIGRDPVDREWAVGLVLAVDRLLSRLHILHPEYFFVAAEKRFVSSDS